MGRKAEFGERTAPNLAIGIEIKDLGTKVTEMNRQIVAGGVHLQGCESRERKICI